MGAVHHLAELNVSHLVASLRSPRLADFVASLEPVYALAERAPGFVWRTKIEPGDPAVAVSGFGDDMIVNLSVWETPEALADFTYSSGHKEVLRRRREWFQELDEAHVVLWWVPAGHKPTLDEAKQRLDLLRRIGPTPDAFTFQSLYRVGADEPVSVAPPVGGVALGRKPR